MYAAPTSTGIQTKDGPAFPDSPGPTSFNSPGAAFPAVDPDRSKVIPRSGDVLHVTRAASVQFVKPIYFRVIRVHDWSTYTGWAWLDGYELNPTGEAVDRRSIFVQLSGLREVRSVGRSAALAGHGRLPTAGRAAGRLRVS